MTLFKIGLTIVFSLLVFQTGLAVEKSNLPYMGEPVDQTLSPQQEKRIGQQFMRQLRGSVPLIDDIELSEHLQNLGNYLLQGMSTPPADDFTFFLVDDPSINAFAVPGGFIGINTGLIAAFHKESQVAAVMAHEIAHISQRHAARAYSNQGRSALTTAAAILAAIVIGQSSPQAGQAALATGIAIGQQTRINYTRTNEYEADRIGIDILINSGFSANGMAESFDIMRKNAGLNTSNFQLEYLRTHPLSNNRIAEAKNRAANYKRKGRADSLSFQLFKTRLVVLESNNIKHLKRVYSSVIKKSSSPQPAYLYGLALIEEQEGKLTSAYEKINQLLKEEPANSYYNSLAAKLAYALGDEKNGTTIYQEQIDLYPERYSPAAQYSKQLVNIGKPGTAYDVLTSYIHRSKKTNPYAFRQLANIQQQLGNESASHEALAKFHELRYEPDSAVRQLELALNSAKSGSQNELRINAFLKKLKKQKK